jgi:fibronectin type 3 domain-containing protein
LSVRTYSYSVAARDAAGNLSPNSASVSLTIADTTPPTTPTGLTAAAAGSTGANLSWSASTDNVAVTGYIVRRNGVQIATPTTTSFADTGLSAATTYSYTVAARDAVSNLSPNSASVSVTTPPSAPSNSASLAWDSVTAPNLSGYRVYFGTAPGTYLQSPGQGISVGNVTTYTMTGLASGSRYYFVVTAFDTSSIESPYSNEVFKDIGTVSIPTESAQGTMLTSPVGSIIDSLGAVWTLGPPDASGFPAKMRNGVPDGSAAVLCYSGRAVNARGDLVTDPGWWKWTDATGSWSSVPTPVGCV